MYCKWCGHHYQNQHSTYPNLCKPCISRRTRYYRLLGKYRNKPTQTTLDKIVELQQTYMELAAQGCVVPEDVQNLMKGRPIE